MNPRTLTRADLVEFATQAASAVADGKIPGFSPEQNAALSEAIIDAAANLSAADGARVAARAGAREATEIADAGQELLLMLLQELKYGMKFVRASADVYDVVGFDPPAVSRQMVIPVAPTRLAGFGYSNGVNRLTFQGNNQPGSVVYIVEAKTEGDGPFAMIGTCTKQSFKHTGIRPGQFYRYRIRAQASRSQFSDYSNETVVYGL
jgi:hypothetical protein